MTLPDAIESEAALEEVLTRPRPVLLEFIRHVRSPLVILGAGGKMGPTLAVLARRAAQTAGHPLEIIAVSRFTDGRWRQWLEERGVTTLACDLLERSAGERLPACENLLYLVGLKFGTGQNPARTWAINTLAPALVTERYPHARIVALSTGNVYPLSPVNRGGSVESDPLTPLGEYANAAVARERIFEFCAQRPGASMVLMRLNYAVELRYGVLLDLARKVAHGEPVDLANGHFNCIWQADANEMIVRSLGLAAAPPLALNLTGPQTLSVRQIALRFGELLAKPVRFTGTEADTALLSNPTRACAALGAPPTPLDTMLAWTAHWVKHGRCTLDKPTHFEVRDGRY